MLEQFKVDIARSRLRTPRSISVVAQKTGVAGGMCYSKCAGAD